MSVTLGELKTRTREQADQVGSKFISEAELGHFLNLEGSELYDLLVTRYQDYLTAPEYTFALVSGQQDYTLPDDFYKLLAIDIKSGTDWIRLRRFSMADRNVIGPTITADLRYRLLGNAIRFAPSPMSLDTVRLWYVPQYRRMVDDNDKLNFAFVNGWEDYLIAGACARCAIKEESDAQQFLAMKAAIRQRIIEASANRDAHEPSRVQRVWSRQRWL